MAEEREYIVPLRRGFCKAPKYKRSKKAIDVLRTFLTRHTKANVKIGQHLNDHIWKDGIKNPPGKVAVKAFISEEDGERIAKVELAGNAYKESVRPEEKVEQAGGLKGKFQDLTAAAAKPAKAEEKVEETPKAQEKSAEEKPKAEAKKE